MLVIVIQYLSNIYNRHLTDLQIHNYFLFNFELFDISYFRLHLMYMVILVCSDLYFSFYLIHL